MEFNYDKLLGRMKEKHYSQKELANAIGNAEASLSLKLNNKAKFKQSEISKICILLEIDDSDIGAYFFTKSVQEN